MHRKGTEYNELFAVLSKAEPNFLYIQVEINGIKTLCFHKAARLQVSVRSL